MQEIGIKGGDINGAAKALSEAVTLPSSPASETGTSE
jgi:hypothetical protein